MNEELKAMNHEHLLEQADILEIDGAQEMSTEDLRNALTEKLDDKSTSNARKKAPAKAKSSTKKDDSETVTVVVEESEYDRQPAYVGLNGKSYRLQRGIEVTVPRGVAQILLTAKQKVRNSDGTDREVPTYPTRVVA